MVTTGGSLAVGDGDDPLPEPEPEPVVGAAARNDISSILLTLIVRSMFVSRRAEDRAVICAGGGSNCCKQICHQNCGGREGLLLTYRKVQGDVAIQLSVQGCDGPLQLYPLNGPTSISAPPADTFPGIVSGTMISCDSTALW